MNVDFALKLLRKIGGSRGQVNNGEVDGTDKGHKEW